MQLVNMLEGRFISPHDHDIAERIATVLCGGEVDRHSLVDEDWLLRLEREHFVALAQMPKTQERIPHMLKDRKSVVQGKSVSVRVDLGGRRIIRQKTTRNITTKCHT